MIWLQKNPVIQVLLLPILFSYYLRNINVSKTTICRKNQCLTTWDKAMRNTHACELTPLHKAHISFSSTSSALILVSEHNRTRNNSMKDKPLLLGLTSLWMALWGFQSVRQNPFWPQSLERTTATESALLDEKKSLECKIHNFTGVMSGTFSLPEMKRGQCWA